MGKNLTNILTHFIIVHPYAGLRLSPMFQWKMEISTSGCALCMFGKYAFIYYFFVEDHQNIGSEGYCGWQYHILNQNYYISNLEFFLNLNLVERIISNLYIVVLICANHKIRNIQSKPPMFQLPYKLHPDIFRWCPGPWYIVLKYIWQAVVEEVGSGPKKWSGLVAEIV